MLEMDYDYNDDGTIGNLTFQGLNGNEKIACLEDALELMNISNPLLDFKRQLEQGYAPPFTSDESDRLLKMLKLLEEL